MKCVDVIDKLQELAPEGLAEKWDNVGLLAGDAEKETALVMVALDATQAVVEQAAGIGADLLITHHPLVFSPLKKVVAQDFIGRRLLLLLQHNINYYAMHTNYDATRMAVEAAQKLALTACEVLDDVDGTDRVGIGIVGELPFPMGRAECAAYVKKAFVLEQVRLFGDRSGKAKRVAIVPGSGSDYVDRALCLGADLLITGDVGHHDGLDAVEKGIAVIDAGHYGLEKLFVPCVREYLRNTFPALRVVEASQGEPWHTL